MKKNKVKKILSIILVVSFVLQNTNLFYAKENTTPKGSIEEENVIIDDEIEAIYEECKSIIIGKLRDDDKIGVLKNSVNDEFKYIEGEVLVYKKNENKNTGMLFGSGNKNHDEFDDLLNNGKTLYNFNDEKNTKLFGGIKNKKEENNDKSVIHIKSDKYSTRELIENLSEKSNVYIVEPNYVVNVNDVNTDEVSGFSDTEYSDVNLTNFQYDKSNVNDEFHKYSVKVPNWNVLPKETSKNSEGVVVAVVDTGVDYEHPDLKNIMWDEGLNYPTLTALGGGKYGICTVEGNVSQEIMDDNSHGTHCSGIVAAEWNNIGVSGVCNGAKIMGIKAGDAIGNFSVDKAIAGFNYVITAKKAGVNVACVSCSWGGSAYSFILKEVIVETEKNGIASIFASGNESLDLDLNNYICKALKYISAGIVVDSSTIKGGMSSFSNYGKSYTDIVAPGSDILSTVPREFSIFNTKFIPDKYIKLYKHDGSSTDLFNKNDVATNSVILSLADAENGGLSVVAVVEDKDTDPKPRLQFNKLNISSDDFDREKAKLSLNILGIDFINQTANIKASLYIPCVNVIDASDKKDISLANVGTKIASLGATISIYMPIYKDYVYEVDGKQYKPDISLGNDFYCVLEIESSDDTKEIESSFYVCSLTDIGIVDSTPIPYNYASGTSMACPQVSGAIAVIAAHYPSETPAKWVARIKGSIYSGATSQSLIEEDSKLITSDTSVTAGLVSIENALQNDTSTFNPVLNNISFEDGKYVLKGFFFGDNGQIKIEDVDYTTSVSSWSDEKIVLDIDSSTDISGANAYFEVKNQYNNKTGHQYIDIEKNEYIYNTKDIKSIPVTDNELFGIGIFENALTVGNKTHMLVKVNTGTTNKIYAFATYDNASGIFSLENAFDFTSENILDLKDFVYANNKLYFVSAKEDSDVLKNYYMFYDINSKNGDNIDIDDSILGDNVINNSALFYDEKSNRIYLFGGELISRDGINKTASKKIYILDLNENKILPFDEELSVARTNPFISRPVKNKYGTTYFYIAGRESSIIDRVEFLSSGEINIIKDYANIPDYDEILTDTSSYVKYIPIEHGFYVAGITKEKDGRKYNNYKLDIENKKLTYDGYIRDVKCKEICGWTYGNTGNILSYTENGVASLMYSYFPYERIVAPDEIQEENKPKNRGGSSGGGGGGAPVYSANGEILRPGAKANVDVEGVLEYNPLTNKYKLYYYDENNNKHYIVNNWCKIINKTNGKTSWYLADVMGDMLTGFVFCDGWLYYFSEDVINKGELLTGMVKINGEEYKFDESGRYVDGISRMPKNYPIILTNKVMQ